MLKNRYMTERRSNYDVVADILKIARRGARKTRIVYGANLNFKLLKEYVTKLEDAGLISWSEDGSLLKTTEKGKEYLQQFSSLKDFYIY